MRQENGKGANFENLPPPKFFENLASRRAQLTSSRKMDFYKTGFRTREHATLPPDIMGKTLGLWIHAFFSLI